MLSPEIINEIQKLDTFDDCQSAWDLIQQRLNRIEALEASSFVVGQKVWFLSKKRGGVRLQGTVVKINKKSVAVQIPSGRWTVAPSLLHACNEESAE
jgi:hypothetical protein